MKPFPFLAVALGTVLLLLAGCGNTAQERMLTGAGIGALGGALLGGMTTPQPAQHHHYAPPGHYRRGRW